MATARRRFAALLLVAAAFFLAGCVTGSSAVDGRGPEALQVASTIFPLADIAREIGGERVAVSTLLPPGASPHTFEPTPEQVRCIATAKVFITVGPGLDDWAARLGAGGSEDRVDLAVLETIPDSTLIAEDESSHAGHSHHSGVNPHVWLDPVLVRDYIAPAITRALTEASPENEAYFAGRLKEYQSALSDLDESFRAAVGALEDRRFISVHAAWTYLARRYGLEQIAVVEAFPGKEPSARWIAGIVDTARNAGVSAIMAEPQLSTQTAEVIAAEFGGRVVIMDPLGGPGLPQRDSYLALMRHNLETLVRGLR